MADARSPVQGAEFWTPRGDVLVLQAGAYGPHTEFARVSGKSRFRRGEGLPGAVWASETAHFFRDLGTHFVRAEHARAAGIDAAVGIPWFRGTDFAGVLTLLLTASASTHGCIELWNHDDVIDVLKHGGGLYLNAPGLEMVSPALQFPYAAGLPGLSWSRGAPSVMDDVAVSNEFVRAHIAARAGLKRAVGIPIFRQRRVVHVLTLIGAAADSFIRAFELFVPGDFGLDSKLRFVGDSKVESMRPPPGMPGPRELLAAESKASRLPNIADAPLVPNVRPGDARSTILLSLPVHDGIRLRAVACVEF